MGNICHVAFAGATGITNNYTYIIYSRSRNKKFWNPWTKTVRSATWIPLIQSKNATFRHTRSDNATKGDKGSTLHDQGLFLGVPAMDWTGNHSSSKGSLDP